MTGMRDRHIEDAAVDSLRQGQVCDAVYLWRKAEMSRGRCSDDWCLIVDEPSPLNCACCLEGRMRSLSLLDTETECTDLAYRLYQWSLSVSKVTGDYARMALELRKMTGSSFAGPL